jgi:penicillin-binding protein 2
MYIEKRKLTKAEIERISFTINIILVVLFIVLLFSFWNIQVLKKYYYTNLADQNITKDIEIKAPRGLILDRNRKRLAENKLNFTLFLVREYSRDIGETIDIADSILDIDQEKIQKKIEKYKYHPESFLIPLEKDLSLKKAIYIESHSDELAEFRIEIEPARAYPFKEVGSHILGYISELTAEELKSKKGEGYILGDIVGKSGIEKQYESYLRGIKGVQTVARDNLGRIMEVLKEEEPVIGQTVILTIDIELQKFVEGIFQDHRGTVGVVDLKTGGILAMVSKPNFNPEFFTGILEPKEWSALVNDPAKPLHNKFLQGSYSPGSVFKIVVALAALQEKVINTSTLSHCSGAVKIYDRIFHCWEPGGHGTLNVVGALKNSCNVFFYRVGKKMDIDVIQKYASMLGVGPQTSVDLPNEKMGLVPTKEWKLKTLKQKWFPGETISVAIGGGLLNTTPIQVLLLVSTVALKGQKPSLHLLEAIEEKGQVVMAFKPTFEKLDIDERNFDIVIKGLYKVVNDGGTGRAAKVPGFDICGKTGTQQIISKENPNYRTLVKQKRFKPHSWFVSFAPRDNPKFAMVVFVENGGDAGAVAAPMAAKIYKEIFKRYKK